MTGWGCRRVPAGALALVLVISIVISAILLGLVGLFATTHRQAQQQECQQRVQRNARSGLAYVLASPALPYFRPQALDLFGEGRDSVVVSVRPWGLFEVAVVVAGQGRTRDTLLALLGSRFAGPRPRFPLPTRYRPVPPGHGRPQPVTGNGVPARPRSSGGLRARTRAGCPQQAGYRP